MCVCVFFVSPKSAYRKQICIASLWILPNDDIVRGPSEVFGLFNKVFVFNIGSITVPTNNHVENGTYIDRNWPHIKCITHFHSSFNNKSHNIGFWVSFEIKPTKPLNWIYMSKSACIIIMRNGRKRVFQTCIWFVYDTEPNQNQTIYTHKKKTGDKNRQTLYIYHK